MRARVFFVGLEVLVAAVGVAQAATGRKIAWSPRTGSGTFDFGSVTVGQTPWPSQEFTLTNSGGKATRNGRLVERLVCVCGDG